MKLISLITLLLINGCDRPHKPVQSSVSLDEIKAKRDLYLSLQKEHQDQNGWLDHSCDGLLFNSLNAYAGTNVAVIRAREESGRWRRTPNFEACKPFNGSKSTISRDMFRGLFLYLFQQKDIEILMALDGYGKENNYVMGEAEDDESYWGRVVMSPSMILQLKDMIKILTPNLTGIILAQDDEYGYVILKETFAAHLHVLNIYLRSQMYGGITDYEKAVLSEYTKLQPSNALFEAMRAKFTDGNFSRATELLSNTALFPSDRLPTSSDRCEPYLWQRDGQDLKDWQPCDQGKVHDGLDLTFAVKVMEE